MSMPFLTGSLRFRYIGCVGEIAAGLFGIRYYGGCSAGEASGDVMMVADDVEMGIVFSRTPKPMVN